MKKYLAPWCASHSVEQKCSSTDLSFDLQLSHLALSFTPVYPFPFSVYLPRPLSACYSATLCLSLSQLLWWRFTLHQTRVMADGGVTTRDTHRERENRDWESTWEMTHHGWFNLLCFFLFFLTHKCLTWGMPLEETADGKCSFIPYHYTSTEVRLWTYQYSF